MLNFTLFTAPYATNSIKQQHLFVCIPLLIVFMIHYVFLAVLSLKGENDRKSRLDENGRRLILYGFAALLSMNFLQNSIYMAVIAWVQMVVILLNHTIILIREIKENCYNWLLLLEYSLYSAWYIGIVLFYAITPA